MSLIKNPTDKMSLIGISISLLLPLIYILIVFPKLIKPHFEEPFESIIGLAFMWTLSALLLVYIIFFEGQKLTSIGVKRINIKQIFTALGLGLVLSICIPAFYAIMTLLSNESSSNSLSNVFQKSPLLILAGIITASVSEELLIRAYPLERLNNITNNNWLGIILSIGVFTLLHLQSWNLPHIIGVVLPLGIILTAIYLKTRSLIFVIIVHFFIDFPLFIISISKSD